MRRPVIDKTKSYSFYDYFKMNALTEEILASFGYSFAVQSLSLPRSAQTIDHVEELSLQLVNNKIKINLTSETARREFLIAPVLMWLMNRTEAKVRVEYSLAVSDQLQGTLDYLVQSEQNLLIVEAKNEDLERGFKQLAAELVAMDEWTESSAPHIYGAVSIGNAWQFGVLERGRKHLSQDLNLYTIPDDLTDLLAILLGILHGQ